MMCSLAEPPHHYSCHGYVLVCRLVSEVPRERLTGRVTAQREQLLGVVARALW